MPAASRRHDPKHDATARLSAARQEAASRAAASAAAAQQLAAARQKEDALAADRVAAATKLRSTEAAVGEAGEKLAALTARRATLDAAIAARQADLDALLPLLVRLSRYPAETLLAAPVPAEQALLGLTVTQGLTAQLQNEAAGLVADRAAADRLAASETEQAQSLAAAKATQSVQAAALDRQLALAQSAAAQQAGAASRAAQAAQDAAARATSLQGVIAAMDAAARARPAPPPEEVATAAPGRMVLPVAGRMRQGFGGATEDGTATGITYAAVAGAFVVSPCAGQVAFAAPFRSYGKLIIVECGGGIDIVLGGLDGISAVPGHKVRAGEPVGKMGERGNLYLEMRRGGSPVDPAPFLNAKA